MRKVAAQRQRVSQLAAEASARSTEAAKHKNALRAWTRDTFGSLEGLSWSFAAGALWASTREREGDESTSGTTLRRVAKFSWIAWPYVNSAISTAESADAASELAAESLSP